MSDSVWPHPWDSPGKNTGMGCHFLLQCIKVKSESEVAQSCPTLLDPWTAAYQAPPSMGFSRQEYWSGVPLPSPISMCLINGSDGKESACNAGDPGSILSWEDPLEKETATTPVFLPGEFRGQRSLTGYSPWVSESWHHWVTDTTVTINIHNL